MHTTPAPGPDCFSLDEALRRESGMRWRVVVELTGVDGAIHAHEVGTGGSAITACSVETLGMRWWTPRGCWRGRSDIWFRRRRRSTAVNVAVASIALHGGR